MQIRKFWSSVGALVAAAVFALLGATTVAHAQQPPAFNGCDRPYQVWYVNGVMNSVLDAMFNVEELRLAGPKTFGVSQREILYSLLFNPSFGLYEDLKQSALQKAQQYTGFLTFADAFMVFVADAVSNSHIIESLPLNVGTQLAQDAQNFKSQAIKKAVDDYSVSAPELAAMLKILKETAANSPLVLVGHSQGSIYVNQLYDVLKTDGRAVDSMTTVGVAAMVPTMKGSLVGAPLYVTGATDVMVNLVSQADPLLLSPNAVGPLPSKFDPLAHGFATSYMLDSGLRSKFISTLTQAIASLNTGCNAPPLEISVSGTRPGWTVPPLSEMSGLTQMSRLAFESSGTPSNTCGGERGNGNLYSRDPRIDATAEFFTPTLVLNAPYGDVFANRRPCSSFASFKFFADPSDPGNPLKRKARFWVNLTARGQLFTNLSTRDVEYQVRIDTGDPFDAGKAGYSCQAGTVANPFGPWFSIWEPSACTVQFKTAMTP